MTLSAFALLLGLAWAGGAPAVARAASPSYTPAARGELDCNGFSTKQQAVRAMACTDLAGTIKGSWGGKVYDNGHYIGHDEPDTTFLSSARVR